MAKEQFDGVVINELRRFEEALVAAGRELQGKSTLTALERSTVVEKYSLVKSELSVANKHGTVGGAQRAQTQSEARYFAPAVKQALIALRASTNSNPIRSRWSSLLSEAAREISYHLGRMETEATRN